MKSSLTFTDKPTCQLQAAAVLAAALLAAPLASADTNTWGGLGGDVNWSNASNWSNAVPASTNDTLFVQYGGFAGASPGPNGSSNNVVDVSTSISSLTYRNTNSFHTTYIGPGVTLAVLGVGGLWVGNPAGVDYGTTATNYTTILGGGALVVSNSSAWVKVREGSSGANQRAMLDLSGLSTFNANVNQFNIAADGSGSLIGRVYGKLALAKSNVLVCSGAGILIGQSQNSTSSGTVYLGQTNAIFSDNGVQVGSRKASAYLGFNTNAGVTLVNPTALFRNRAGTGPMNYFGVSDVSIGGGSTTGNSGVADFTGGSVDLQATTIYVSLGQTATSGGNGSPGVATLTWTNGTITAGNVMEIGDQTVINCAAQGTVNVGGAGQLTVGDGTSLSWLRVGNYVAGSTYSSTWGRLNIGKPVPGGSVWVNGPVVDGGASGNAITNLGGSLKVSGMLGSTLSSPPSAGPLATMTLSNATLTFDLGGSPNPATPWWTVNNLFVTAPVTSKVLGYALTPGQFTLLKYNTLAGDDGSTFITNLASLPPHVGGYLSNNIASTSVDLIITNVASPKWNGNLSGDWDIDTTANWLPISGGAAMTYQQPSVPGDSVLFDDTASGTTTVNLTTNLSPASITVNNSLLNYTFTGLGALSGVTGLQKNGSGILTLSNTGTNTFSGAVSINGGTVRISGNADRLPANAAVTLANDSTAWLDLNNTNQALRALLGGGSSGGNVNLGTGTLTFNGAGGPYSYGGVISGSGMLVKSGSGTQVLTGTNVYTGGTVVNGGTLVVANTDGSGIGPGSIVVATNATFTIGDGGADGIIAATTITNSGTVVIDRSDDLTFTNHITGPGGFTKNNYRNTVTITNANSYTGQTLINAGTLLITDPGALGTNLIFLSGDASSLLKLPGGLTLVQPVNLDMKTGGSLLPGIDNVSGTNILAGPIILNAGGTYWNVQSEAGKLIVGGPCSILSSFTGIHYLRLFGFGDGEWWGNLNNSSNSGETTALNVLGPGSWTLWGTNGYTGNTLVSGGELIVNGALLGTTNVTVGTDVLGASATLSGTGLINGPVTITGGATLCGNGALPSGVPSGAPLGRLTISNSLTLKAASTTIVGVSPSGCDQVAGLSQVTFSGTLQVVVTTGRLVGGEAFKLFDSTTYSGVDFDAYFLPDLGTPLLSWDTTSVTNNGTLRVAGSVVPQITSVTSTGPGNLQLSGTGPTDWTYSILATTNITQPLSNWVQVASGSFTGGIFSFSDPNAASYPHRFYRVVTQFP